MTTTNGARPFHGNVNFNAQHSPMGAFMSFTCGHFGTGGGIGVEIGSPADQGLIVGVKKGDRTSAEPIKVLPFFIAPTRSAAADFQVDHVEANRSPDGIELYDAKEISRHYGWATDAWTTPDFKFSVYSPFGPLPDPETSSGPQQRAAVLPAITATLEVDNRAGDATVTAVFGLDFKKPGVRTLSGGEAIGFAWKRSMGVLATLEQEGGATELKPFVYQRWSAASGVADVNPNHALGSSAGIAFEVPAGGRCTLTIAIGVYLDGVVTTGLEGKYWYTRYYGGLLDVLAAALSDGDRIRQRCAELDRTLAASGLSADQQFLIAHATRSYYGSTQLLDVGGEPFWVVNEGEYCMMNTLDLAVDQVFWELEQNPWVVRNLLDRFVRHYSYVDELQLPGGKTKKGGLSFTHDMGVHNNFSPTGYSSYELGHRNDCFSYMTAEQLCNWVLMATCYVAAARDERWLLQNAATIEACLASLIARGGESGMIEFDSTRCEGGQEITTYDSLDTSLAQTRQNAYMAVKCWASYLGLMLLANARGASDASERAFLQAQRVATAVVMQASVDGVIPAVFESGSSGCSAKILPVAEGLVYIGCWQQSWLNEFGLAQALESSKDLIDALRTHTRALLLDSAARNRFGDGGLRLSSTSNNSWMSKIAIFQHITRIWFGADEAADLKALFAMADATHVRWQTDGSAYWACSDQFVNGVAKGSRFYPRIITTALWLQRDAHLASVQHRRDLNSRDHVIH